MLTDQQLATLKAAILAETTPSIVSARSQRNDALILDFYNSVAPGPVKVWRNDVEVLELVEATIEQMATYDNLSQGKRDAWELLYRLPQIDFTRNKIRSAPGKVWASAQRDAILADPGTRNGRRIELLTGSGFGASDVVEGGVTAKKCAFLGQIEINDVSLALNLP